MMDKKYLKELYNMNQDIKKVFEVYYIFNTGIILNAQLDQCKGMYIESDLYSQLYRPDMVIMVNSLLLFEIFKKYKISQIERLEIKDSRMIGAVVNGEFQMFAIYKSLNEEIKKIYNANKPYIHNIYEYKTEIDSDQLASLMNKESINVFINNRRLILCKSAIPAIKKNSNIQIEIQEKMIDNIFYARLRIDNLSGCIIYRTFRCLNV